jgi:F-type H+-transporting ATPase subunit g
MTRTAYKQPLFYNLAVARELLKHIYRAENLSPPSLSAIQSAYSTIFSRAVSPAFWREAVVSGEILRIGVYGLEAYGIYKVRVPRAPPFRVLIECVRLER